MRHNASLAPAISMAKPTLALSFVALLSAGCVQTVAEVDPQPADPDMPESADSAPVLHESAPLGSSTSEPAPAPAPEPAPAQPPIEVADSELVAGAQIDPNTAPGLQDFADEFSQLYAGGSLWVGPLEGNGGRDVLIFIPPKADPAAEFELVFHFHGTYSELVQRRTDAMKKKREWVGWDRLEQTLAAIDQLAGEADHNVALIYPISAGKRLEPGHRGWSNVAYDRMWMQPAAPADPAYRDDFDRLHADSLEVLVEALGVHPSKLRGGVIVEGHSAGGQAVTNVAVRGSTHVGEYLYLDASFMGWSDVAHEALAARNDPALLTMVVRDGGIADPFEGRDPWCLVIEHHAKLWTEHAGTCGDQGPAHELKLRDHAGERETVACEDLELDAESFDELEDWCREMADEMRQVPRVTLIRTKVVHAKHPRSFSGGLGLPEDRGQ
ncbi:hypothetical protein PPSIR1_37279 [Plesiocystis pacifica SIR-1]|uniref:Uncharacterized protein n=2 Tax=Plesiocystis pacifica TaxID=191768 RepID=A6G0M1_9BACT|nr:hypothetical protein PPSIR1_37279 [Plesiocystis pacifica SIR-1]